MANTRHSIEKFNGASDFSLWKIRMLAHLRTLELRSIIFDFALTKTVTKKGSKDSGDGSDKEDDASGKGKEDKEPELDPEKVDKSEQAMSEIILHVGDSVLRKIQHCKTAAEMWKLLNELYMETSLPNRIYLQQNLYKFKMTEGKSISDNVDDFLKIIAELENLEIVIGEEVKAVLILNSLPPSFDQLKHTLKYGNKTITLNDVVSSAKSIERELSEKGESSRSSSALVTTDRGRSQQKSKGHDKSRSRSASKDKMKCWFCKKTGHLKKDCYKYKKKNESDSQAEAGVISEKLVYTEALSVQAQEEKEKWVIDSGCTYHMTSRLDWFSEFNEDVSTMILLGDDHTVEAKGSGTIRVNTNGGTIKYLQNVRYVPNLRRNLISTGTLDKLGYHHEGSNGQIRFYKNDKLALKGNLVNGLYLLDGYTQVAESCVATTKKNNTNLWHYRLGHLNINSMRVLSTKGLIRTEKFQDLPFCEQCVMGKSKKLSFNVGKHDTKDLLGYVHADLWGSPNVTPSLSGMKYFLSMVDDKSRKVWLMFLKSKDETFDKFCVWKDLVESQSGKKVKVLRTDNGLEFCNLKFNSYCEKNGIERHRTCAYTPQQNGVAERMNRTLMERVRCLLNDSGLEESFWAETAATAAYLINRSPASAIDHNVPEEIWLGRKPGYDHLRRFGSMAYVHQDQGKLKPRALKGVFLGYPQGTKGYKIWLIEEEKCVISRDVVINEQMVFKDYEKSQTSQSSVSSATDNDIVITNITSSNKGKEVAVPGGVVSSDAGGAIISDSNEASSSGEGGATAYPDAESSENEDESVPDSEPESYHLIRDRAKRITRPPARMSDYTQFAFALVASEEIEIDEPKCYHEALKDKEWENWHAGMKEEMNSLWKNKTWELVDRPTDQKVISNRWLYTKKLGIPGVELGRFKARLVARGFTQKEGVDYEEIFAPVVKHISIRILMSIVVHKDLELEQMDVKTAFLHGEIDRTLYMEQPEGFIVQSKEDKVCLLKKSLYGLKQSPRQWNTRFNDFMLKQGFARSYHDSCVYVKETSKNEYTYLLLYVDDMLIAAKEISEINKLKEVLKQEFEMKDMGPASKILGINIERDRAKNILYLSQSDYIGKVIKRFNMDEAKSVNTPIGGHFKLSSVKEDEECVDTEVIPYSSAVGSVMYAMIGSRPDVAYAMGLVSRFMSRPGHVHWEAVKWLLRYLKGSQSLRLMYTKSENLSIQGFCDSDFAGDLDKRRSLSGYTFMVGGNVVSWKSCLQHVVALSTTEAEYVSLTESVKEALWIKGLLKDLGFEQKQASVWCDSQSAICLSKNGAFHERTKHIAVKYHFVREVIDSGDIEVKKVHTSKNPADILTKCVPVSKFSAALDLLKLVQ